MESSPRGLEPARQVAAELVRALARFARLTTSAREALERGEVLALAPLLAERQDVLSCAAPLVQELIALGEQSGADSPPELAEALGAVERAGRALQADEAELRCRMLARRNEISSDLALLGRASAARTAYSRALPLSRST